MSEENKQPSAESVGSTAGFGDSLVAAIEGNLHGMSKDDLVLTCQMLESGRAVWRREAEGLREQLRQAVESNVAHHRTLVMIKRELDPHISDPTKYELPRSVWEEVVRRHGEEESPNENKISYRWSAAR